MFRSFAPAKVNLFLHVTGRRADGYHLLDSLAVFPAVGDWVSVAPAGGLSLEVSGPFGEVLRGEADNLLLRAARVLKPGAGAALGLEKNLPVASGIGGGSADAAAALRLLARVWGAERGLEDAALALGADVPVCLARRVARMGGIGEVLTPGPALPAFGMVLVNPGVAVATPAVFRARTGDFSASVEMPPGWDDAGAMAAWLAAQRNDLEGAAIGLEPVIAEVLAALDGALLARMSGSGATCFGIYETPARAAEVAHALARPGWWCWGGGLYEPGPQDL